MMSIERRSFGHVQGESEPPFDHIYEPAPRVRRTSNEWFPGAVSIIHFYRATEYLWAATDAGQPR